jgi:hypothetical protein
MRTVRCIQEQSPSQAPSPAPDHAGTYQQCKAQTNKPFPRQRVFRLQYFSCTLSKLPRLSKPGRAMPDIDMSKKITRYPHPVTFLLLFFPRVLCTICLTHRPGGAKKRTLTGQGNRGLSLFFFMQLTRCGYASVFAGEVCTLDMSVAANPSQVKLTCQS